MKKLPGREFLYPESSNYDPNNAFLSSIEAEIMLNTIVFYAHHMRQIVCIFSTKWQHIYKHIYTNIHTYTHTYVGRNG